VEPDEDEYQHVTQEPRALYRGKDTTTHNPAGPYDLWDDLAQAKANISFGQLIQLAPSLRKQMREGATVRRILKRTGSVHQVLEEEGKPDDNIAYYNAIEITVEIVDKMITYTMVDDGSNTNIMPESTMKKLGLAITEPSFSTIKIADQGICKPIGRIRDLKVSTGGEDYHLTFEVLPMKGGNAENGSYPLLLGRGFLRASKGVADWGTKKPTFTYGPPDNRTKIEINPARKTKTSSEESLSPTVEAVDLIDPTNQLGSCDTIKCIGPGLYDFTDDGTLAQWLAEYPHSDDELTVQFMEASELPIRELEAEVSSTYGEDPPQSNQDQKDQLSNLEDSILPSTEIFNEELLGNKVQALAISADDIPASKALYLEIDEVQDGNLNAYLDDAVVANDLLPPIHFQRTLEDIQVGHEEPILPSTPNDWYQGSADGVHVPQADWKGIDIAYLQKKLKNIKRGVKHTRLFWEIREVLTSSGIPPELTEYRILLLPGTRRLQQKGYRLDISQSLKDCLASLEALNEGRQLAAQHVEATQRRKKVAFDKCQKKRTLLPGMWVMIQSTGVVPLTKLKTSWTGPYVIKEVFFNDSIQLKTLDGVDFLTRTNGRCCEEYKV
jgi:hypothetical protein